MRWKTNGIAFNRGCYVPLIAQFNGQGFWWSVGSICTQQSMKEEFKALGEFLKATDCEVKKEYDDNGNETEKSVVSFRFNSISKRLVVGDDEIEKYIPYEEYMERRITNGNHT